MYLVQDKLNNVLLKRKKVHCFVTCCETSKSDVLAIVCGVQLCPLVGTDIFLPAVPAGRFFCRYFDEQSSHLFLTFERGKCSISVTAFADLSIVSEGSGQSFSWDLQFCAPVPLTGISCTVCKKYKTVLTKQPGSNFC